MSVSNPYEPPQSLTPPAGITFNQKKLLLVLAIQVCLPGAMALFQQTTAFELEWSLCMTTFMTHTVCLGCALALLWPRWIWVLLTGLFTLGYCAIWIEYQRYLWRQLPNMPEVQALDLPADLLKMDYTFFYIKIMGATLIMAATVTLILFYRSTLVWQREIKALPAAQNTWQDTMFNFGYYGCVLTLLGALTYGFYDAEYLSFFEMFAFCDLWCIAMIMILFFTLLQRDIDWQHLGFGALACLLLWFGLSPSFPRGELKETNLFLIPFCGLGILTVWLYRWAGFRIVPRRDLALHSLPEGQL